MSAEGKILWGTSLGHVDQFPETLGVLDPDGRLIFGFIGKLYGSQIGIAPARSGWPMPSGSWRNANFPYVDSSEGRQHDVLYAYSSENSMSLRFTSSAVDTDLVLETSTDLENWMEVLTSTDEIDFTVSTETGDRFYRVRRAAADK